MSINELQELFVTNIYNLYKLNMGDFLIHNREMGSLDFTNKMLVFLHDRSAIDVKSEGSWLNHGRKIKDNAHKINIIVPKYKTTYIDTETGKTIQNSELTVEEFNYALRVGIIEKKEELLEYSMETLYDIRDTIIYDPKRYDDYIELLLSKELKISRLLSILESTIELKIVNGETTGYRDGKLVIGTEDVNIKLGILIDVTSNMIINQENRFELTELEKQFISDSISYSIKTYTKLDVNKESINDIANKILTDKENDTDRLILLMDVIESYVNLIINMDTTNNIESEFIVNRKAERLLNILEANFILKRIRGGL